jgi:adenine-specific DNA methylase
VSTRGETHPAGYLIHKYWSRKPHNVLRALFERAPRGLFVDPFCGSGVALSEAAALGFDCVGADVNPIARLISEVTLAPADPRLVEQQVVAILDQAELELGERHAVRGEPNAVRFVRHETVIRCPSCGRAGRPLRNGKRYACRACGAAVRANLESLIATEITAVATVDGCWDDRTLLAEQESLSEVALAASRFDVAFPVNRRTLSFEGLSTARLFTARNFACLDHLARALHALDDPAVRAAALVLLTSSVAQCSRLVASRNDLATGGQAWTVPGFWVPPIHLETNPLAQIRTRLEKLVRGLVHLRAMRHRGSRVIAPSASDLFRSLEGRRAAVVFLDPPYGDSVPYVEFSALWNSFLGVQVDPDLDIAVTDRGNREASWGRYESALASIVSSAAEQLAPDGSVVVTFNNKDARAWTALLRATQAAGLFAERVAYGAPAVVPTKAQLAPHGSYVGDFYCVLRRAARRPSRDLSPVVHALRGGSARAAMAAFLEHHVAADLVSEIAGLKSGGEQVISPG